MSVAPSPDIVQAIVTGLWPDPYPKADPFAVLGMHVEAGAGVVVRSFQPDAESVEVLDAASGRRVATLERIDAAAKKVKDELLSECDVLKCQLMIL